MSTFFGLSPYIIISRNQHASGLPALFWTVLVRTASSSNSKDKLFSEMSVFSSDRAVSLATMAVGATPYGTQEDGQKIIK